MESTNSVQKKSRKKTLLGVLALVMAVALLCGSLFAFFSDKLTGSADVSVGTLDLVSELTGVDKDGEPIVFEIHRFDSSKAADAQWGEVFDKDKDVLNPGDILRISTAAKNIGSKSGWATTFFYYFASKGVGTINDVTGSLSFYKNFNQETGELSGKYEGKTYAFTDTVILNGSKEEEDDDRVEKIEYGEVYTTSIYLQMDPETKNAVQGATIFFDVIVFTTQYRNNNSEVYVWIFGNTELEEYVAPK